MVLDGVALSGLRLVWLGNDLGCAQARDWLVGGTARRSTCRPPPRQRPSSLSWIPFLATCRTSSSSFARASAGCDGQKAWRTMRISVAGRANAAVCTTNHACQMMRAPGTKDHAAQGTRRTAHADQLAAVSRVNQVTRVEVHLLRQQKADPKHEICMCVLLCMEPSPVVVRNSCGHAHSSIGQPATDLVSSPLGVPYVAFASGRWAWPVAGRARARARGAHYSYFIIVCG